MYNNYDNLFTQYKDAFGYRFVDINSKSFQEDFYSFVKERKKQGYRYLDFLYEIRREILERTTAEVGKCEFDSLVEPFNTTIISPYDFDELTDKTRLIPASFQVIDEEVVLKFLPKDEIQQIVLPRRIDLLMTENPYNPYSILDWDTLHNSGNYDIAVGIYGSIYDKDIKKKLDLLKSLKEKILLRDYKYDYNVDNDIYYAALVSDRHLKKMR